MSYWRGSLILQADDYILLGVDSNYQTFIDLGGHFEKEDGNIIKTAFREFDEETLGVFGNFLIKEVITAFSHGGEFVIVLKVPTSYLSEDYLLAFEEEKAKRPSVEVSELRWISLRELPDLLKQQKESFYFRTWFNLYIFSKKIFLY